MDLARLGFASHIIPGAWRCSGRNNDEMVDKFVHSGLIVSKEVEDAFRAIPRGAFVPPDQHDEAYYDSPLRGDPHVHMSAPHMYATVLEALDLCPGLSFLNVGSGTGYFNCLVGHIIKRNSINHGIEQYEDLVEFSRERCEEFTRFSPMVSCEMSQPVFIAGNCFRLDTRDIQYDRIYCGAACPHSKLPFILSMTKVRGFAIIPCKNKLLKIDRVSTTGVKLSVIREVSFATLAPLPDSEASQPKLKFPPVESKKKQKSLKVFASSNLLVSNGHSRKTLAKLRALHEACECLQESRPLPSPFIYVPNEQQLRELRTTNKIKPSKKELKSGKESEAAPSPVDGKFTFFSSCTRQDGGVESNESDMWDFLYLDKLWETVVENYYSICSVSPEKKKKALDLYVKKKKSLLVQSKPAKAQSYADLMSKIGLPVEPTGQKPSVIQKNGEKALNTDGIGCRSVPSVQHEGSQLERDAEIGFLNQKHVSQGSMATRGENCQSSALSNLNLEHKLEGAHVKDLNQEISCLHERSVASIVDAGTASAALGASCFDSEEDSGKYHNDGKHNTDGKDSTDGKHRTDGKDSTDGKHRSDGKDSTDFNVSTDGDSNDVKDSTDGKDSTDFKDSTDVKDCTDCKVSTDGKNSNDVKDSTDGKDGIDGKENIDVNASAQSILVDDKESNVLLDTFSTAITNIKSLVNKEHLVATNIFSNNSHNDNPNSPTTNTDLDGKTSLLCGRKNDSTLSSNEHIAHKTKKTEYVNVLLEVDEMCMDMLNSILKNGWCIEDDMELVRFLSDISDLSSKGRCKGWFKAELVRPKLFSRLDNVVYPRLGSHSTEDLAFRSVALCRVAKILDSLLYLLSGPSLLKDIQSSHSKYPLESFGDWSFESTEKSKELEVKQQTSKASKEEMLPFEEMISERDAEQLRIQHELTSKKLKLTQDLQDQFKEQQKVLKKQASLLEEKQLLVQNLKSLDIKGSQHTQTSESPAVMELKLQRQEALSKIQKLVDQHAEQDVKKTRLVEELKRLRDQRNKILHSEARKKEATEITERTEQQQNTKPYEESTTKRRESNPSSPSTNTRYQLSAILPKLRFLLPLCRQRWRIVQEMLHVSEHSAPDHMPIVTVDRRAPLNERGSDPESSVLLQVYKELRPEKLNYRWNKWKYDQWWEVKFIGEGIIDQGGGFRDSLVEIADEICPPEKNSPEVLPFFIKTPNNKDGVGDYQDSYIPKPSCHQWSVYEWIGKLLGAVYRSDENLTLSCPPFFWKLLVGAHVTWAKDFGAVDEAAVRFTDELELMDEELYLATYGSECKYSTVLSDGTRVNLIPDGNNKDVMSSDRHRFAFLMREARMTESVKQILAIKKGLISVIPESVLRLLTWNELERGICGNPEVSLAVLKTACKYGDDHSESSECIKHFWAALAQFTNDERSRFLRFVTGRRRPPAPFTVAKAGGGSKEALPHASTCASSLFWPNYPSAALATARLRYAIYNCIAIDTDTNPW